MIVSPDQFLVKLGFHPTRDEVAEAWRNAHRTFSRLIRSDAVTCAGIVCGIPGAGKSTWARSHDREDVVMFDAVFSHVAQRRSMARKVISANREAIAVYVGADVQSAARRVGMRAMSRRVPIGKMQAAAARFARSPLSADEGWSHVVVAYS